jgi:hypothetical protein
MRRPAGVVPLAVSESVPASRHELRVQGGGSARGIEKWWLIHQDGLPQTGDFEQVVFARITPDVEFHHSQLATGVSRERAQFRCLACVAGRAVAEMRRVLGS